MRPYVVDDRNETPCVFHFGNEGKKIVNFTSVHFDIAFISTCIERLGDAFYFYTFLYDQKNAY